MMADTRPMAVVTQPGKVEILDRPLPDVAGDEVRIKVKAVTICGSDLHIFKGKHPAAPLPVPVGHEIAGEVEQVGPQVRRYQPGDRVIVEPVLACGECYFCQRGQYHLCTDISFQYRQGQGGLTTRFIAQEKWLHRMPEGISYAEGALVEPLSVALHALKKSELKIGDTSVIFGAGAIGLFLLQLIQVAGGGETFVVDVQEFRLSTARQIGAAAVFNNLEQDVVSLLMQLTDEMGVDKAFEAVGINTTLVQALRSLKKGGRAILLGLFEKPDAVIPANLFVQKEIGLLGSQGYCWDFQSAIQLIEQGKLDLKPMLTHYFPLSRVQEAFEVLRDPKAQAIKVVITMDD
jgi:2-desacetyl-2-hydroxyethyl bacteriochlorophyllide A dehydrogenase